MECPSSPLVILGSYVLKRINRYVQHGRDYWKRQLTGILMRLEKPQYILLEWAEDGTWPEVRWGLHQKLNAINNDILDIAREFEWISSVLQAFKALYPAIIELNELIDNFGECPDLWYIKHLYGLVIIAAAKRAREVAEKNEL